MATFQNEIVHDDISIGISCDFFRELYDIERRFHDRHDAVRIASWARDAGCDLSNWNGVSISPTGEIMLHW